MENKPYSTVKKNAYSQTTWYWITISTAILTALIIFIAPNVVFIAWPIRPLLGIMFVLFLPGYALTKALFLSKHPSKVFGENLDLANRAALSVGMSLALTSLGVLALNYTPFGISAASVVLTLLALTIVLATAGLVRELKIPIANETKNPNRNNHN